MALFQAPATSINSSLPFNSLKNPYVGMQSAAFLLSISYNVKKNSQSGVRFHRHPFMLQCSQVLVSESNGGYYTEEEYKSDKEFDYGEEGETVPTPPPVLQRRRRYRRLCPGETKGIVEEMRFVAMKLRNRGKIRIKDDSAEDGGTIGEEKENGKSDETWEPSLEGYLKYLVDSKLVFNTIERIVDESIDVSYAYFRKTGLERSDLVSMDLDWFGEQGNAIPDPSNPGTTYAKYLEELSEKNPPLFLCHFYNIYFSHIVGGQVIAKQVSNTLFKGREMGLFKWEEDPEELLRRVREKLNALGEHWSREEKNKCLREVTKTFRFLEQIVRLIIL